MSSTSKFVIGPVAADDLLHRFLRTHFDPRVEERRPLGPVAFLLQRSDIRGVSDRPGGLQKVSVLHIPESR